MITAIDELTRDAVEECMVPKFKEPPHIDHPECASPGLAEVVHEYKELFQSIPGSTDVAQHFIPTIGIPVKLPRHQIPACYRETWNPSFKTCWIGALVKKAATLGWHQQCSYQRNQGDLHICIDYRSLHKMTKKDAYPLPLPDKAQNPLSHATIFSKLDLHSGYCQMPVHPDHRKKTAFCLGRGMGLFQFCRMPFGMAGAPISFQCMMDSIFCADSHCGGA